MKFLQLTFVLIMALYSCQREEKFEPIGERVAGPIDIATSQDGSYFYVLNSDYTRDHKTGSILILNEEGEKVGALEVPRLGRFIVISGHDLLVGFDRENDAAEKPMVKLYDISDPLQPVLKKEFPVERTPFSAVMREGYKHFAVSTIGGHLMIGTLADERENSELKLVRNYNHTRRAMYLDPVRELLFAFIVDIGEQTLTDATFDDVKAYKADTDELVDGENEVPDVYEDSRRARRQSVNVQQTYQFVVYDIAAEREVSAEKGGPFPLREYEDTLENTENFEHINGELRWMYYPLFDSEGDSTPDVDAGFLSNDRKNYHTNFWHAVPDPEDADAFYLSQRNPPRGSYNTGNNVLRVQLRGDPRIGEDGKRPFTRQFFSVTRVYGNAGEIDMSPKLHYPGDFSVVRINGQKTLLLNHFRDLVVFRKNERRYSIVAKDLENGFWRSEIKSSETKDSYYQIAVNNRGVAMSCAFYGNAVIRLVVSPGTDIREDKRIQ